MKYYLLALLRKPDKLMPFFACLGSKVLSVSAPVYVFSGSTDDRKSQHLLHCVGPINNFPLIRKPTCTHYMPNGTHVGHNKMKPTQSYYNFV